MKTSALFIPALALCSQAAAQAAPEGPQKRPNIVVFIADDLLSTEIGCYGGRNIDTPNIDRIAREGVQFSHCFASEAMSVPIRASMYTGLYPMHHGSYQNHKDTYPGTLTSNYYMPREGYRVGRTGKDHPVTKEVYNFDEIPGFTVNCVAREAPYSVDGIREWMSRSDDPFLLYVCSIHTHMPWSWGDPSEFDPDKLIMPDNCVDNHEMRVEFTKFLAELRCLDNEVGDVYKTLQEIGKLDDTIFLFLGEQGPQIPGSKWTLWYTGCHSALLARYPARIKAGSKCDAIVQYEDLLPTFIDIAGGQPKPELDGVSFKDALFGQTNTCRKYAYGIHNNFPEGHPYPIRSIRDDRYGLIWNLKSETEYHEKHVTKPDVTAGVWHAWLEGAKASARNYFWKERFLHRPEFEFYDLKKDPWEEHNLAGKKKYAKKIAEMKAELEKWMASQGDTGADVDIEFENPKAELLRQITDHDKAVFVGAGNMRDPFITLGPDGMFYLSGTISPKLLPVDSYFAFNTGLVPNAGELNRLRIWRSPDLVQWQDLGYVYSMPKVPGSKDGDIVNAFWAPEFQWTGHNWVMTHCPAEHSEVAVSEGESIAGPWKTFSAPEFEKLHDTSLFQDEDGRWYMTWGFNRFFVAELKPDFSGFASEPVQIGPSDRRLGHEGTVIRKIGSKYVLFGTGWSTDIMRKGSYNLYYCTADRVTGPYGPRKFVGRFLGHGMPFKDKRGRWWCSAFFNADAPQLPAEGIETRDLGEKAQTINGKGVTLVPLTVRILPDGDIYIRAIDPHYATPGPDEVQKFE
ncbi:MAG: sulfatase-like hydrolase/transferase [Bacteroidales bacterium]|nr:sulfatase-like hydrolase/transferase [Bacteroidales bacterium]